MYYCYCDNKTHPFDICVHPTLKVRFGHPIIIMIVRLQGVVRIHCGRLAEPSDLECYNRLLELTNSTEAENDPYKWYCFCTANLITLLMAQVVFPL